MPNANLSFKRYSAFLNVCFLIATSGYVLTTTVYSSIIYNALLLVGLLNIFLFYLEQSKRKIDIFGPALFFFIFLILLSTVSSLFNPSPVNFVSNVKFIFLVFFCFTVVVYYKLEILVSCYMAIMYWVCIISLLGYFVINVLGMSEFFPLIHNSNEVGYRAAYVFFSFDGFLSFRNTGVFWEPGLFSTMIYFTLLCSLYFKSSRYKTLPLVLIVTLITTFSSAGVLLLLLYLASLILSGGVKFNMKFFLLSISFIALLGFTVYFMINIVSDVGVDPFRVFDKITSFEDNESHRLMSPLLNITLFYEKPIVGWGMVDGMIKYIQVGNISLTSTSTFYLMAFGFLGSILLVIPVLFFALLKGLNFSEKFVLLVAYFFIQNKEPHVYFSLNYVLIFYMFIFLIGLFFVHKRNSNCLL